MPKIGPDEVRTRKRDHKMTGTTAIEKAALRDAFGAFATGVTVVTARTGDGRPVGFTANSFTSVSLDPPLLLICLGKSSSNHATFAGAQGFGVNILAADQADVSCRFAAPVADRFADLRWRPGATGAPLLDGVAAWFDCALHQVVDAGDHIVLIGRITDLQRHERAPLIYLQGRYLAAPAPAPAEPATRGSVRAGYLLRHADGILLQERAGGWTLPIGPPQASFRAARLSLEDSLTTLGLTPHCNGLYSVFDDPGQPGTWMFFLGQLTPNDTLPADMRFFAPDALPLDRIESRPMRAMLQRYVVEARTDSFGVFVDDARTVGHVARFAGPPTPWQAAFNDEDLMQ